MSDEPIDVRDAPRPPDLSVADPESYDVLYDEWDSLVGAWIDRGAEPAAIWAFMLSIVLSVARENDQTMEDVIDVVKRAWAKADELASRS